MGYRMAKKVIPILVPQIVDGSVISVIDEWLLTSLLLGYGWRCFVKIHELVVIQE
jgi:hypothetical protein